MRVPDTDKSLDKKKVRMEEKSFFFSSCSFAEEKRET